ncbi:MAG: L-2-hydroxyglutarate oxidase [Planctomycetota bacterium]
MKSFDLVVIGGGIVGVATAYQATLRRPGLSVAVLEKEPRLATHQTGRNSGVLHSGIYYRPGSLKARLCVEGKRRLEAFCDEQGVRYERCGKVIVAVDDAQRGALDEIERRGAANGVGCERIGPERLREIEPHAAGVEALHVPSTGIVDYAAVTEQLAALVENAGGEIATSTRVLGLRGDGGRVRVATTAGEFDAREAVNCAGLQSDRVAAMTGGRPAARIVPFRGEYYKLRGDARRVVRNLIYPTPDPRFPFLGVHFTRMIDGAVECGPNAVLALAREGYNKAAINPRDLAASLGYGGFLRLAAKHWRMGAGEAWRSVSKRAFVRALQRLAPDIRAEDLEPAPAGIRAQAVAPDGGLVDDFLIERSGRVLNVVNAPSPAATASLVIGETIADRLLLDEKPSPMNVIRQS